ncbi:MAG: glutamate--tRNA ligase, partial [Parahaliea sp.]
MTVRTRVAPSPTGDPHVGTAYVALFNLCFARAHGGQFLLRIEDTDQVRSTPESERVILDSLRWLGLEWDEGPDIGGPHGPYRQSERRDIYAEYAHQLVAQGQAFVCYRTGEELDALREARREAGNATALKPSDLQLPEDEVARREAAGAPSVIRMMVPQEGGRCEIDDMLRGTIELDWSMVDAQVLLKSDGLPTYHLANVVDDHLMGITHVLRGEEWINSAPKHKLLYQYFGWEMPKLCHLPLLRNPDKSKLSKRRNPTSILYYQRMGFLPEALLNYLGRMGWSMPDEREKFSLAEMREHFDIQRVSLGGPIFDMEKLRWLNGLWIREDLDTEQLARRLTDWAFNGDNLRKVLPHAQQRMETLSDFAPLAAFLVSGTLPISV